MKPEEKTPEEKRAWEYGYQHGRKVAREELEYEIALAEAVRRVARDGQENCENVKSIK